MKFNKSKNINIKEYITTMIENKTCMVLKKKKKFTDVNLQKLVKTVLPLAISVAITSRYKRFFCLVKRAQMSLLRADVSKVKSEKSKILKINSQRSTR